MNPGEINQTTTEITETIITPKIINMSAETLTPVEIELLSKGLKFTPSPKYDQSRLKLDIEEFTRKLRLSSSLMMKVREFL